MVNLGTGRLLKGGGNGCDLIRVRFVSGSCQVWVGFVSSQMVDMGTGDFGVCEGGDVAKWRKMGGERCDSGGLGRSRGGGFSKVVRIEGGFGDDF